jgi:putative AdoMet-dependent methyltransferase
VFKGWAEEYDAFVQGEDEQYRAVFSNYDEILEEIVARSGERVIEFGIGTGNLTKKLVNAGKTVFPIEPSVEMREKAKEKLPQEVEVVDGDMQSYPIPDYPVDTIVSSYVFHHLTDSEKAEALKGYAEILEPGGKVVFSDTLFVSEMAYRQTIEEAARLEYHELVADLQREYYPILETLYTIVRQAGFTRVSFTQMNEFVWMMEARVQGK